MESLSAVFDHWDSREQLASDIGVKGVTVRQWANRNRLPAEYFARLVSAAQSRGFNQVTYELLCNIAAKAKADAA